MSALLAGMRLVECAAFIAAPFASLNLAKLGAEVIRIDPVGGGVDQFRWPVTAQGHSLYWAGLNKGKRSVCLDLSQPEGRDLARALICAPDEDAGIFLTNLAPRPWLSHESLAALRPDLISLQVVGNADGSTALDYTVNAAVGFPLVTGRAEEAAPVNHVLPAWDLVAGMTVATALLAAERQRRKTGKGERMRLALSDVALSVCGDLGYLAEVQVNDQDRQRLGNHIYGAFGHDFETADGRRIMVAAVSVHQWKALCAATGFDGATMFDESARFAARDAIADALAPWFGARSLADAGAALDSAGACWGPYQSFRQLVEKDPRCSTGNPLFEHVPVPHIGTDLLTPRSPVGVADSQGVPAAQAPPRLGEHTRHVLDRVLGLPQHVIDDLCRRGVARVPETALGNP
ncbi:MAG: mct [Panacagrimonas sp.]|jgi:2-methylfumaryl-CoA isomerase|nr:mct [Panacagrimonas sp.]